ncbi:vesicle transport protein GOT1A isoform X1 [Esox lucius]|uniref:Golgi transport 1A n=1 Tax=Esox lucius TaxID=8010 RepID=A0AAY5L522_ESOLU|nr:vesicle transport protein GOT1A isoform X1 [Esox lucius]
MNTHLHCTGDICSDQHGTLTGRDTDSDSRAGRKTVLPSCSFPQVLFLAGLAIIIGLRRTASFFFQKQKLRGSTFFLGGIALVLFRWPVIGMAVESYGFVLLFRSFFPVVFGFLSSLMNIPYFNVGNMSSMV